MIDRKGRVCFRFFVKQCADIFGPKYDQLLLERGINFTNDYYGAEKFSGTRVVFVNGAIDPWHALSFTKDPPNNNTAIFLQSIIEQSISNSRIEFLSFF